MVAHSQQPALRLVGTDADLDLPTPEDDRPDIVGRIGIASQPQRTAHFASHDDRRIHPRQQISLRVRGRRIDNDIQALREPHLNLNVADVSVGGMRAISQSRLLVGERVAVYFPPTGGPSGRGWDACGRVIRVEQQTHQPGCTIAVSFDRAMAA
ncbi:MAG: PilZ domain-containing protein [Planctomycetota bacterium]